MSRVAGHESRVPSHESRVPSPESRIPSPESRIPSPESRIPSPESRVASPGARIAGPVVRNPRPATRDPGPRAARGFTLFELAVSIVIISVLAAVLLNRLGYYQELAEKAAMESALRTIKTGLQIRLAELIVTNRQGQAAQLETEDPIRWLDDKPPNYGGPYRAAPDAGAWYFDAGERQLVYVVKTGDRLELDTGRDARELRFRTQLLKDRVQLHGIGVESVTGVALLPLNSYRWQ